MQSFRRFQTLAAMMPALLLTLTVAVHAQDTNTEPLPQPTSLSPTWWSYLDVDNQQIEKRASQFQAHLDSIEAALEAAVREPAAPLFDEIKQSLASYVKLKLRAPEAAKPLPPTPDQLSLAEFMALAARVRETSFELELEQSDMERQEQDVKTGHKRYDDLKAVYLSEEPAARGRLEHALILIRDRLNLALAEQQLRLFKPLVEQTRGDVEQLRDSIPSASERIRVKAEDETRYRKALIKAERSLETLRNEATFARLRDRSREANSPLEWDRARLQTQSLLNFEIQITEAELAVYRERLSLALVRYMLDPDKRVADDASPQAVLRAQSQFLEQTRTRLDLWRESTDRERAAAASKLTLSEGVDAASAKVQRARIKKADEAARSLLRLREQIVLAEALSRTVAAHIAREEGRLVVWTQIVEDTAADSFAAAARFSSASLITVNGTPVTLLGLLRVAIILTIAWWVSKLLRQFLDRTSSKRRTMNRASMYTLGRLFHYLILALGILIALSSIGIDVTKFALLLSAVGIGLGFGLQAIFNNFVAGLIILFEKSLKVGDFVDLESGVRGEVREINIRSTLVTTNDNVDILVPNSEFVNGRVTNWTLRDAYLRLRIPFGVAFGTDKDTVREAGLEAAGAVSHHVNEQGRRAPQVWLVGFGDSGLEFELVVWLKPDAVRRPNAVHAAYYWAIESGLRKHGIQIGLPQRALHLQSGFSAAAQANLMRADPHPANTHAQ